MIKEVKLLYDTETWDFIIDGGGLHDIEVLGFIETGKIAVTRRMMEGGNNASTSADQNDNNGVDNSGN